MCLVWFSKTFAKKSTVKCSCRQIFQFYFLEEKLLQFFFQNFQKDMLLTKKGYFIRICLSIYLFTRSNWSMTLRPLINWSTWLKYIVSHSCKITSSIYKLSFWKLQVDLTEFFLESWQMFFVGFCCFSKFLD